ncbi:MAG: hypothetical protein M1404_02675 [Acidobacteria bacterium]|nr:hypothetical protein [Acidobacteriota bacterium]
MGGKGRGIAIAGPKGQVSPHSTQTRERPRGTPAHSIFYKIFSFQALLAVLLLGGVVGTIFLNLRQAASPLPGQTQLSIFEGDTWWHLTVGEQILATHTWPTVDHYSFTAPGDPWIAYEWLGDVVMAAADRAAGLTGLAILYVSLTVGIVLLMFSYAYIRSRSGKASFVACALLLPLAVLSFTLRPQLLGYIFLLITLILLERFRQGKQKSLWILPGIFLVWINTHGTFAFGLAVLVLYWASGLVSFEIGAIRAERWSEPQRRRLGLVTLLSLVALVITPYGTRLAAYPLQMAFFQPVNIAHFEEWRPLDFGTASGKIFLAMLLLILLVPLVTRIEYRLEELGLLLFGVVAACLHMRFVIVFALLFAPVLAGLIARYMPPYDPSKDKYVLNAILMALIAFGCVKLFPSRQELHEVVNHIFPQGAVEYIEQHPLVGRTFNEEYWGGYLISKLEPERKVFIDGRADLYEAAGVLTDYFDIQKPSDNALFLLRKYGVRSCLIRPGSSLAVYLDHSPGWDRVYSDELCVLYVRQKRVASNRLVKKAGRHAEPVLPLLANGHERSEGAQDDALRRFFHQSADIAAGEARTTNTN